MKVLVATSVAQGTRSTDVMRCVEGEFVYMIEACPYSARRPYGSCDCGITFRGMTSDEVTTTAIVRAVPGLDLETYVDCLDATHRFKHKLGCTCDFDAVAQAWNLTAIAGMFAEGTIVERLVDRVIVRRGVAA
ncbi:hypothetical protein [Agromyces sp. NPDC049794]|uniref:DUF7715 family protein n=1 Tax=unclassified Agromyces TaxID=2639701 RepID=UPI0033CFA3B9